MSSRPIVIQIASPEMAEMDDLVDRISAIDPRIDVRRCVYEDEWDVRVAKGSPTRTLEELRALDAPLSPEQAAVLAEAEIILGHDAPIDLPRHAPNLRWIHSVGSGVGNLRQVGILGSQIVLTNSRGVASVPVAEFALARVLSYWKRLPELDELQQRREWKATFGNRLDRVTMSIIGMGEIGSALAARAKAFGMRIVGVRRSYVPGMTMPNVDELYGPDGLVKAVSDADIVVIAAPGTPETENMVNGSVIAAMPRGTVLVNVGRGTVVDEEALIAALRSGHLRAAMLDVMREEPLPPTSPLWDAPNTYLSPHCAVALDNYFEDVASLFVENLERYLRGESLKNVVDVSLL